MEERGERMGDGGWEMDGWEMDGWRGKRGG